MAGTTATILIPDISGFTEFMTNTELSHSSFAISMLINTIIDTVAEEYQVSEIEGDAVLMFRKGSAPRHEEIQNTCLKIFNAFHSRRQWMQQHAICPCKACNEISSLTLKFVAHHGPVGEIKAGGFTKLSGTDVIVAHRLLKNSVPSNEYLLLSEKLLQQTVDPSGENGMNWTESSDDYGPIGKVDYRFALLNEERKKMPEPLKLQADYPTDAIVSAEISINANFREAYMVLMNIPNRTEWLPTLKKVDQQIPAAFIGSIHFCTYDNYEAIVSPLQMTVSEEDIAYAESCQIESLGLSLVYEYIFSETGGETCMLTGRIMNTANEPVGQEDKNLLFQQLEHIIKSLKEFCE